MGAVGFLVRIELRSRWRSYLAIALLVGVVGAVVLTLLAGARRTDTALGRLRADTHDGDASIEVSPKYFDAIEARPEVEAAAPGSFFFVMPTGAGLEDLTAIAGRRTVGAKGCRPIPPVGCAAVRAELARRVGDAELARASYHTAIGLCSNDVERTHLRARLDAIHAPRP